MTSPSFRLACAGPALLCLLALAAAGCDGSGKDHLALTPEASATLQALDGPPVDVAGSCEVGDERRPCQRRPLAPWRWQGRVPPASVFTVGAALLPAEAGGVEAGGERFEVVAELTTGRNHEVLDVVRADLEAGGSGWVDLQADLSRYAGDEISLTVTPRVVGGELGRQHEVAWSFVRFSLPGERTDERPNVLFVLVDTLRADHLTPYGYDRPTSPVIQAELADRGVVVETAYSQAPWTVPSAVSYMTSRYPGELLHGPMETYAIPAGVETMAERFQAMGYNTAAFYGNFVLRDANGFGRGFGTRFTPPAVAESNLLHADTVNRRALPWLRSHQHLPFFLYLHYMDPHDPYDSPELVGGRSPFLPDYSGTVSGLSVHGLYTGALALADPEQDLAHIKALYDSEIRTVDRAVGEILTALDPAVAANTLVVLTADHGEELLDHGGWKHGQTLYQEQIHVPLIFRWDARLPAGRRLAGTVPLLDLLPTLAAAAGGEAAPEWQGMNLLPALAGRAPLPRRAAFAQHLASGPLRAAAVVEGRKLMLFNREEAFAPANTLIDHLWQLDRGRMARQEVYDLAADPAERSNLAPRHPELAQALEPAVLQPLDRTLSGLRVVASGLPAGTRLFARITFAAPPDQWHPLFLGPQDVVRVSGNTLELELAGEEGPAEKVLWLDGEVPRVLSVEPRWSGASGAGIEVLVGAGNPYRGGALAASALAVDHRPVKPQGPALRLWLRRHARDGAEGAAIDPEVEKSLRALGYIQ